MQLVSKSSLQKRCLSLISMSKCNMFSHFGFVKFNLAVSSYFYIQSRRLFSATICQQPFESCSDHNCDGAQHVTTWHKSTPNPLSLKLEASTSSRSHPYTRLFFTPIGPRKEESASWTLSFKFFLEPWVSLEFCFFSFLILSLIF